MRLFRCLSLYPGKISALGAERDYPAPQAICMTRAKATFRRSLKADRRFLFIEEYLVLSCMYPQVTG
jgi:hypothetical protein